jgi:hypothetical protein
MRATVLVLSFLGALVFGGALVLSWANPLLVERAAREALRIEVERRVGERIDELSDSRIADFGQRALRKAGLEVEETQDQIRARLPQKVAEIVGYMLDADCACRLSLVHRTEAIWQERLVSQLSLKERLERLVETSYANVRAQLLREFRIFTGSNALAFILLGAITLARPKASLQLLLPALVLVGAVAVTGSFYLFGQDWLHTIVFGDYVGWAYALYLAGVASLLADIAFNRARVSTQIVNLALNAVGSVVQAVPC